MTGILSGATHHAPSAVPISPVAYMFKHVRGSFRLSWKKEGELFGSREILFPSPLTVYF